MRRERSRDIQQTLAEAVRLHKAGRLHEAERHYRQILQQDAAHSDALHLLGVIAHQQGRNGAAVDLLMQAIAGNARVAGYHNNLGNALRAQGRPAAALDAYRRALALQPDHLEARYNLGVVLHEQGAWDEAAAAYRQALSLKPDHAGAHCNLGNVHQAQGRLQEAEACYRRALSLQRDHVAALGNLANVLTAQGRLPEAVACYQQALLLDPTHPEVLSNYGSLLLAQGDVEAAVALCRRAVSRNPRLPEAHYHLANALRERGDQDQAIASYQLALSLRPDYAEARLAVANAAMPVLPDSEADSRGAADAFARALAELADWSRQHPGRLGKCVGSSQPFYLAYRPGNPAALLARYGDLMCAEAQTSSPDVIGSCAAGRRHPERIRLLVVSGQVRRHPVWDVITRGIVAHLDRSRFEVLIYHTASLVDAQTAWARQRVDQFIQGPRPLTAWLEQVRQDRPDVIFYPELGMDPTACALAARRLAPIQAAGWGHPVTTGLPSIDLFVSGQLLEGPEADQHYRERLVRLPGTGVCTEMSDGPSQPWSGPERPGELVRFAVCQQPIKFDPLDDPLLPQIAAAVGRCEFWLASPPKQAAAASRLRRRLARAFTTAGLDADAHLRVMPWLPTEQFMGFLDLMDVFLDCPGFSGYTTAWQAAHRGLPIVTLEGEFLRQRLAAGLLRQIGISSGIASSRQQYVELAVSHARQSRQSAAWVAQRASLRAAAAAADRNLSAIQGFEEALAAALCGSGELS